MESSLEKAVDFDVIVVGAGHAGVEASLAAARRGCRVGLVTLDPRKTSFMSCNPSIGGLGKGHMVKEIDALGGEMGRAADETCIQFKRLNGSKGPAVRGTRMQCDKDAYSQYMQNFVSLQPNIKIVIGEVKTLQISKGKCSGVLLSDGNQLFSKTTVITTGTFMNAVMHVGFVQASGGRVGEKATVGISDQLREHGLSVVRLKTGTPARLAAESIDYAKTQPQFGEEPFLPFSIESGREFKLRQVACYLSYTNSKTHEIIRQNLDKSPMYCGIIEGVGPRYCPSIEDKVVRFPNRDRHQTFLEPEGLQTNSVYLQGLSTSLPADVQEQFIRTIAGLENVKILRPGYAVEYDFIEPTQIYPSLEVRTIENLFLAGQINGTSGYEEAAAQGLMAGVNAAAKCFNEEPLVLGRHEAYIGVLIDDLVTKGTKEPYRMMTARAEHRLVLREDNNFDRLNVIARRFGLLTDERQRGIDQHLESIAKARVELSRLITPNQVTNQSLKRIGTSAILKPVRVEELLRRPEVRWKDMKDFGVTTDLSLEASFALETEIKYQGYIHRELEVIERHRRLEGLRFPIDFDFSSVKGLSSEEREKLSRVRPQTMGQAQRISGVNPSAIQALIVSIVSKDRQKSGQAHVQRRES